MQLFRVIIYTWVYTGLTTSSVLVIKDVMGGNWEGVFASIVEECAELSLF